MSKSILRDTAKAFAKEIVFVCKDIKIQHKETVLTNQLLRCATSIGANLHEDPEVPNYGNAGRGPRLFPGMTIAVEPMINIGSHHVRQLADGWTVVTADGSLSAHYEHTIAITEGEAEILTKVL